MEPSVSIRKCAWCSNQPIIHPRHTPHRSRFTIACAGHDSASAPTVDEAIVRWNKQQANVVKEIEAPLFDPDVTKPPPN